MCSIHGCMQIQLHGRCSCCATRGGTSEYSGSHPEFGGAVERAREHCMACHAATARGQWLAVHMRYGYAARFTWRPETAQGHVDCLLPNGTQCGLVEQFSDAARPCGLHDAIASGRLEQASRSGEVLLTARGAAAPRAPQGRGKRAWGGGQGHGPVAHQRPLVQRARRVPPLAAAGRARLPCRLRPCPPQRRSASVHTPAQRQPRAAPTQHRTPAGGDRTHASRAVAAWCRCAGH